MRKISWTLPIIVAIGLIALFLGMHRNLSARFEAMEEKLYKGEAICLDRNVKTEKLADLLYANKYAETHEDARFMAEFIQQKLTNDSAPQTLESLQELNKRIWQLPAGLIEQKGSEGFRQKLAQSRLDLGLTDTIARLTENARQPSTLRLEEGGEGYLIAKVSTIDEEDERQPMPGTVVRLDRYQLDSLSQVERVTLAYARTDAEGIVRFEGLNEAGSYSLLPIRMDYEFGNAKGTVGCTLADLEKEKNRTFTFTAQDHRLRLFNANTLQRIRDDQTLLVRTPEAFIHDLDLWFLLFLLAWIAVFAMANLRGCRPDVSLASTLMAISGLSFLLMFGINDPLTERMLGKENAQGIVAGVIGIAALQRMNIIRRFQSAYGFDLIRSALEFFCVSDRWLKKYFPKGTGYAAAAIFLTCLLLTPLGVSVGGMRVNLNLGIVFQPSEIAKYLMVIFMAALFYYKGDRIIQYSNATFGNPHAGMTDVGRHFLYKIRDLLWILGGILFLLGLYLGLGDMGPAMVMTLTFIVLYSLVKSRSEEKGELNDFGMLIIGVLSFIGFLWIGQLFNSQLLLCGLWFIAWLLFFGLTRKQVFESALFFNLIITAFLFSGGILHFIHLDSAAERLEDRKEMCVNTWGDLGLETGRLDPGVNTQVAEGLWGLASGGLTGQGLGNGSAKFIPAYHTDMILQSIGEQTGFLGLLVLILLLTFLLRRTLQTGYRSNHLFTFYLCTGIAVVTAVQLLIITLGSTGCIPLTGITVPLLSYGRVSMILNLLAFGAVLSISTHCKENEKLFDSIYRYKKTMRLANYTYGALTLLILCIFFKHQVLCREETMLKPAVVYNTQGAAAVHYNPRIERLAEKMRPGNIYDRKGVLIATSFADSLERYRRIYSHYHLDTDFRQVQQRYYPFSEHLFFLLGDYNNKLFFSSLDESPRGFMAEARYLSELRGYDNRLYDKAGNPVRIDLVSDRYQPGRFFPANQEYRQNGYQLRDYSALLPYLKAGYNSDRIERFNARDERWTDFGKLKPQDLTLTVDAGLQTRLQQKLQETKGAGEQRWHRFQRTSVVVLDAHSGDLLASAVSPLPDYRRLANEDESYSDYEKPIDWQAYTDMDLGMVYSTPPGSTAKVMSALAGIRSLGDKGESIADKKYEVYAKETIHKNKNGSPIEPTGSVDFNTAIVNSSNNYFINLVNDLELYDELADIYAHAGIRVNYSFPYLIDHDEYNPQSGWTQAVTDEAPAAIQAYRNYIGQRTEEPDTHKRMKSERWKTWDIAWGQGMINATPLAMARVAATVCNDGKMPVTRYLLTEEDPEWIDLTPSGQVSPLQNAMINEAHKGLNFAQYPALGGKTGTPERVFKWCEELKRKNEQPNTNDAWYICYVKDAKVITPSNSKGSSTSLAIVVRIERTGSAGSGTAKLLVRDLVMPTLEEMGYVK